jgi:hypothetical protein
MSDQLVTLLRSAQPAQALVAESPQNKTKIRKANFFMRIFAACYDTLLHRPAFAIVVVSTTLATSPRHSEHKPTSNRSPSLTTPVKLVIVTSWRHLQHQTLDSNSFFPLLGMLAHNLAAWVVNLGMDSMAISVRVHSFSQFFAGLEARHIFGRNLHLATGSGVAPLMR